MSLKNISGGHQVPIHYFLYKFRHPKLGNQQHHCVHHTPSEGNIENCLCTTTSNNNKEARVA
jgi:hypothetical protein